jgi:hypothetical protein
MVDVAATGCDATCSYQFGMPGFGGARVLGYCETTTDYCGTRCAGASNCRATEICTAPDRVTTSPPFYCLPR